MAEHRSRALSEVLDQLEDAAAVDAIAIQMIVEKLGRKSFASVMLVFSLISTSPDSTIPGITAMVAMIEKRVTPWWMEDGTCKIALTVRYGSKPIEFEKGKAAILLPNKVALVGTLDTVMAAVRAGELDEILAQQAKARVMPTGKRAAS